MTTTRPDSRLGTDLGPYRIERVLGRGGMGVVYLAEQRELGRNVALKLLPDELAHDADFRARFERESRLAAAIDHPNVIPLYEAGEVDGVLFLAMRYVDGTDLASRLHEGPLPSALAIELLAQVAGALDAAHAKGLVHRDVKPGNVLLDRTGSDERPHAYLTDFGLTKQAGSETGLTRAGAFLGTPAYMAPEQVDGTEVDGRADQYALGAMAFECLTGRVPFVRDKEVAVALAHLKDPVPSAVALQPGLPAPVDVVLAKVMAKDREARYPSCAAFIEDLRSALGGGVVVARPVRKEQRRRTPLVLAAVLGLGLLVVAGVALASGLLGGSGGGGASPSGSLAVGGSLRATGSPATKATSDFPDRAEAALLTKVPAESRSRCLRGSARPAAGPGTPAGQAQATIRCTLGNVTLEARQLGEPGPATGDVLVKTATDRGVQPGDCMADAPAVGPWSIGATHLGTVACYQDGVDAVYEWTLDDEGLLIRASVEAGARQAMRDMWVDLRDEIGSTSLVIANFLTKAGGGKASFKESLVVSAGITPGSIISGTADIEVDGDNYAGSVSLIDDGKTANRDLVEVDGRLWTRTDGGSWVGPSDPTGVEAMINPFRGVTPSTVTSLGTVSSGGKTLYRLDATKALPMDLSLVAPNVVDPTSDTYTLTFDVLQDGTPVSGRAEVLPYATGTLDGTSVKIESYTDWTFTDFGQPATIAPPA